MRQRVSILLLIIFSFGLTDTWVPMDYCADLQTLHQSQTLISDNSMDQNTVWVLSVLRIQKALLLVTTNAVKITSAI
jgi:hypothetical protein